MAKYWELGVDRSKIEFVRGVNVVEGFEGLGFEGLGLEGFWNGFCVPLQDY